MDRKPTIRDIARQAGVSPATASLALRNDPRLRKDTCSKVQHVAEDLGYHPNALMSQLLAQLRTTRTPKYQATLALVNASERATIMSEVQTFREWERGSLERATQLGYGVDKFWLYEEDMSPQRLATIFRARNIRGVIVAACVDNSRLPRDFDEIWKGFACVLLGVSNVRQLSHLACNDQYMTGRQAFQEAIRLGYRQPALVISEGIDSLVEGRFSGSFLSAQNLHPAKQRVPPFFFHSQLDKPITAKIGTPEILKRFGQWYERHQPDVIICIHPEIKDWVESLRLSVPKDVGLIHLDWNEELKGWAGMNQNNHLVGAAGIDMLIGQLHRNELGIPSFPKCLMVESSWVMGQTVRQQPVPKKHPCVADNGVKKKANSRHR